VLTNTVVLFLREMLPLAIMLVFLLAFILPSIYSRNHLILLITSILLGIITLFNIAPILSELFDGAGLEISISFLLLLTFISLTFGTSIAINKNSDKAARPWLILIGICIFSIIKTTNFLVYVTGYIHKGSSGYSLTLGLIIALGICISFATLYYFALLWLRNRNYQNIITALWALFIVGQFCFIVPLLAQIDLINDANILWDSSPWIKDSSEYGHILNAMMGYEATPSDSYILVYAVSLMSFYGIFALTKNVEIKEKNTNSSEELL